jgi:uncharacterized membrane protein YphA (DoxX/SURF4 family)
MTDLDLLPEGESDRSFPDLAIRLGVAVIYLVPGLDKFSSSLRSHWVVLFRQIHAGSWFRYGTGVVECVGALLVLIPRAAFFGLPVLSCTMLCASLIVALVLHQPGEATFPGFLFLVLSAIAFARRLKGPDRRR